MASRPRLRLLQESFPEPATRDVSVSHAILRRVSDGAEPATLRIHRPGHVVAFGPLDRLQPGYPAALAAAAERGFGSIQRLAGGRAAVFHPGTIAFALVLPDPDPRLRIRGRFEQVAGIVAEALGDLGVDARIGAVPGEYCPGEFSVNARGRAKVMGVGQRVVARAAHVGGVVVVSDASRVRDVLVPVYEALAIEWDPDTAGSVEGEVGPVTWDEASKAILRRFGERFELAEGRLDPETMALARALEPLHAASVGTPVERS